VDARGDIREFLTSRRARVTPAQVGLPATGIKRLHHPIVGDLELTYETMELSADRDLTMFAYTAEPGSTSAQNLDLLATWAATTADMAG
jgi:hypothetical protein